MPTHAATTLLTAATPSHSPWPLVAVITLILLGAAGIYLLECWLFPFTPCHHTTATRALRCRRCDGTGKRLRPGRHLLNHLRDLRRHR